MPYTSNPPSQDKRTVLLRLLLTPQEKAELVQLSREQNRPVAEVVRTALHASREQIVMTAKDEAT